MGDRCHEAKARRHDCLPCTTVVTRVLATVAMLAGGGCLATQPPPAYTSQLASPTLRPHPSVPPAFYAPPYTPTLPFQQRNAPMGMEPITSHHHQNQQSHPSLHPNCQPTRLCQHPPLRPVLNPFSPSPCCCSRCWWWCWTATSCWAAWRQRPPHRWRRCTRTWRGRTPRPLPWCTWWGWRRP